MALANLTDAILESEQCWRSPRN